MKSPTQEQAGVLIAIVAVIFGGWMRLLVPQIAGFPVNDGGLFYVMVKAIQANGLRIPGHVLYNGISIPFAYPPLGLYAGALVSSLFRIDPLQVVRWMPAAVLILTLPAFYLLAKSMLGSAFVAGLATLMYAFTPRAITWQVMGGGLTRSFGQVFLILAALAIYETFTNYSRRNLILAIFFSALVVLSHPEAAIQTVGTAILLWLFKGRSKQGIISAALIGAGTLVLSAVWWLPAILRYGAGTLLAAAQTGQMSLYALAYPVLLNFVDEPFMTIVAVTGMLGFAVQGAKGHWLVPAWLFLPFLTEPRSAPTYATIPLALLAGTALGELALPALAAISRKNVETPTANAIQGPVSLLLLLFVSVYMLGSTAYSGVQLAGTRLGAQQLEAFAWVRDNTPLGSRFLVLTGNTADELFCDAPLEWFPALTERISMTTIQGNEWLPDRSFDRVISISKQAAACLAAASPLRCIEGLQSPMGSPLQFDYLYVARTSPTLQACRTTGASPRGERLVEELRQMSRYVERFESDEVAIFARR